MRPHVDRRQARVLALVRARGSVRVVDLAQELGVSPVTLRRDIEGMAARGEIQRMHGVISRVEAERNAGGPPGGAAEAARVPATGGAPRAVRGSGGGEGLVVGMVVPTTEYYYADVVRGARETVEARGARLTVGLTRYLPGEDRTQADRLLSTGAHGLLLTPNWEAGSPAPEEGSWTARLPVPTVLVERWAPPGHPAAALDRVTSDHAHGAACAVRHLAELGHRRIALASRTTPTTARLRAGYEAAVTALGLEPAALWPTTGPEPLSEADLFARTLDYLHEAVTEGGVTAALIHSDTDAIMLIPRLTSLGIRVPEDLTVITYDDEVAGLADVPLSAVAPAKREVGARAATLLLDRLTAANPEDGPREHLELLPRLTVRR
ncbi:DeoR family transcriptional regulator [Streptomyces subrutilus]|uniref:DeoR family transcriptional regulator n=1 Tax=Streptomyces subrutilus TaxID=36818 RepID=A0A5P2UEL5_9ACTN|nr:substrate-binding domain-containing protein [Streptomyces subrutilus]QEU77438.1 DeoR family transcriptional regulator [Streptomyces subrutilus]GGZ47447.1 DeoR family transcriptional regulator [Streptomyces subrutilus]